jgi:hypothetical protein
MWVTSTLCFSESAEILEVGTQRSWQGDSAEESDGSVAVIELGTISVADGEDIIIEASNVSTILSSYTEAEADDDYDYKREGGLYMRPGVLKGPGGKVIMPEPDRVLPISVQVTQQQGGDYDDDHPNLVWEFDDIETTSGNFFYPHVNLPAGDYTLQFLIFTEGNVYAFGNLRTSAVLGPHIIEVRKAKVDDSMCNTKVFDDGDARDIFGSQDFGVLARLGDDDY